MYVCVYVSCMHVCICVCMYVCVCMCVYVPCIGCLNACMCVMYAYVCVCLYVVFVCMSGHVCVYISTVLLLCLSSPKRCIHAIIITYYLYTYVHMHTYITIPSDTCNRRFYCLYVGEWSIGYIGRSYRVVWNTYVSWIQFPAC